MNEREGLQMAPSLISLECRISIVSTNILSVRHAKSVTTKRHQVSAVSLIGESYKTGH